MVRIPGDDLSGFGDASLRRVGAALLAAMQQRPTMCLHRLAKDRAQTVQFGRFLDNEAVSADEMLVQAGQFDLDPVRPDDDIARR